MLIEHGINIYDKENLSGNVSLQFAVSFGHMIILKLLIKYGAYIDFKALDGETALIFAVSHKQTEMAEFLIENGVNVNSTCTNLKTPLHFALSTKTLYFCFFKMVHL